jgi:hypothetical protein
VGPVRPGVPLHLHAAPQPGPAMTFFFWLFVLSLAGMVLVFCLALAAYLD